MEKELKIKFNQKIFIDTRENSNNDLDPGRTYIGFFELETNEFIKLRINDQKMDQVYWYCVPKKEIKGIKIYA